MRHGQLLLTRQSREPSDRAVEPGERLSDRVDNSFIHGERRMMRAVFVTFVLVAVPLGPARGTEPAKLPAKEDFFIFLLAGQSNMAGRGKPVEEQDRTAHPRVLVFSQDGQWQPATNPLHWDKPA